MAEIIQSLKESFDGKLQKVPDHEEIEFWFARDIMELLGYARWENFVTVVQKAITSCESTGFEPRDHFRGVTKMITIGKGGTREVEDFMLMLPRRTERRPKKTGNSFCTKLLRCSDKEAGTNRGPFKASRPPGGS